MRLLPAILLLASTALAQGFTNFEIPPVHPVEISQDGKRLYVANLPDNRIGIYSIADPRRPILLDEIFVGLGPTTVRERTADEVWVVNYLSDTISVVSLSKRRVTAVIRVEDEPTDVVFAKGKALVSVAGSDEVRVFDAATRKSLGKIEIFGDEPRNLVVSSDGSTAWVVVHRSGNETTVLHPNVAPPPPKPTNSKLPAAPKQGLIVHSEDPTHRAKHKIVLPDYDLVEIDVVTQKVRRSYRAVGTINFGAALRPGTNEIWVANTEARNLVRFEPKLRGHAVDNRVTRVTTGTSSTVTPFDLNPSIDYTKLPNPAALRTALAQPTDVVWDSAGKEMYVAAFGTDRIGVVDASGKVKGFVEVGSATGANVDPRNKRGPRALALHGSGVLFVLNSLRNSLTAIDTAKREVIFELALPDPTPRAMKEGRGFLYDAKLSGNGSFSCAACHIDGDTDGIAWDLGDPSGDMFRTLDRNNQRVDLHPMKGPMLTQTLKGLANSAPFHWRGDKNKLEDFNPAFDKLMGGAQLSAADMKAFVDYMLAIRFGSNPNVKLDDSLPSQEATLGRTIYTSQPFAPGTTCNTCHTLPTGSNSKIIDARTLQTPQAAKTPHLRNIYKRLGNRETTQGRKSGFGLAHEGTEADVFALLSNPQFRAFATNTTIKNRLQAFIVALGTGTSRAVGYQVMANQGSYGQVATVLNTLIGRARAGAADLVAKGRVDGESRSYVYRTSGSRFDPDTVRVASITLGDLIKKIQAGNAELVFTGVAPGNGVRIGIDRDLDGVRDGDEGVTSYGQGTAGCAGVPTLRASGEPFIGNPWFSFVSTGLAAGAPGLLGISSGKANLKLLGVDVLIDTRTGAALYLLARADQRGRFALRLPIPADQSLIGVRAFNQILWNDRCGPQGVSATPGLEVRISKR